MHMVNLMRDNLGIGVDNRRLFRDTASFLYEAAADFSRRT